MKKKCYKRVLAGIMAALMSVSMIMPVLADNHEDYGLMDDCEEEAPILNMTANGVFDGGDSEQSDGGNDDGGSHIDGMPNPFADQYALSAEQSMISFGTQTVGAPISNQEIKVTNVGNRDVKVIWKESDPNQVFKIITPDTDMIRVGETIAFLAGINSDTGVGSYSASVLFADETDPAYSGGVQVQLSITMIEDQPTIDRITINPGSAEASPGSSLDFSTKVEGHGSFDSSVSYSVSGAGSTSTQIDGNGHLSIGSNENSSTIKITATSNQDSSKSDVAIVSIKPNMNTVNAYASPSEGGTVTGGGNYTSGSNVNLGAYANNGWKFVGWSINDGEVGGSNNYVIQNISSDTKAVAVFEQNTVKVKAEPNHKHMGSVYGDGYVNIGDSVKLEAEAKDGYEFKCWMEGKKKVSTDKKFTVKNVTEDRSFMAVFVKETCKIKVAVCDETMGKVSDGGKVKCGDSFTIKATPNKGYKFLKWICNDNTVSESAEYTLKDIQDDMCLVALFQTENPSAKLCKVTSGTTDSNGVISPAGTIEVEEGKSINFTVTPKSGYRILAVAVDGKQVDVESSFTFSNIKGDHTVVAAFAPNHENVIDPNKDTKKDTDSDLYKELKQSGSETYGENIMDMDDIPDDVEDHDDDDDMDNRMDSLNGTLQSLNISRDEAESMIDNGEAVRLLKQAIVDENLVINVSNDLTPGAYQLQEGVDAIDDPNVGNMANILAGIFSKEELMDMASGDQEVSINICIAESDAEYVNESQKEIIAENLPEGMAVGSYFYASFVKNVDGVAEVVSELPAPLRLRLRIPDEIKAPGREFAVVRLHNTGIGENEVSILKNQSIDNDTIMVDTDRFSTYAIIYTDDGPTANLSATANNSQAKGVGIIIAVIVVLSLALAGVIAFAMKGKRKSSGRKRR